MRGSLPAEHIRELEQKLAEAEGNATAGYKPAKTP